MICETCKSTGLLNENKICPECNGFGKIGEEEVGPNSEALQEAPKKIKKPKK